MILTFILVVGLAATLINAQFDPICFLKGPAATFYKVDTNGKENITDGSTLNASKTTFFIFHGWAGSSKSEHYEDIGRELSASGNAILVDYSELGSKFYGTCGYYIVGTLGKFVAKFIIEHTNAGLMEPSRIHIIASSLAAHAAGKVGREVKKSIGKKIKRISALDPSGPLFSVFIVRIPFFSLRASDAEIVDVLHTSAFFGTMARMGTVEFYVQNWIGVNRQSACGWGTSIFCSHKIGKEIFLEAINSCGFVGTSNSWFSKTTMIYGMHMPLNARGSFSFKINSKPKYAKGNPECTKTA